jgi:N-acetyl-anhydromuramyl-L-alanine amidase AmpD
LELCQKYAIPKENVLRHKDIAPGRKIDIADSFWNGQAKSFEDYKNLIFNKN